MNSKLYMNLARNNLKTNKNIYLPYMFITVFFVMMFYQMQFLATYDWSNSLSGIAPLMGFAAIIIAIFSFIFMFYTNSFLMKQREREFGVFNILGMEKKHIAKMMAYENMILTAVTVFIGLVLGIIFSQFSILLFQKLLSFDMGIKFSISFLGIIITLVFFVIVFNLILLSNLKKIHFAKPIELLRTKESGEKEPKSKMGLFLVGIVTLALGYYLALTVQFNVGALGVFFVAVVLVIIATYCLFIAGSIVVLKLLKKNKKIYYKLENFTAISGMLYRMKKNAAGLANICILSCMVLVTVGTTTSMLLGANDSIARMAPREINIMFNRSNDKVMNDSKQEIDKILSNKNIKKDTLELNNYVSNIQISDDGKNIKFNSDGYKNNLIFMTLNDYNKAFSKKISLEKEQILMAENAEISYNPENNVLKNYKVKQKVEMPDALENSMVDNNYLIVFKDNSEIENIIKKYNLKQLMNFNCLYSINTGKGEVVNKKIVSEIDESVSKIYSNSNNEDLGYYRVNTKVETEKMFYTVFGVLFFIGLFLGAMFMVMMAIIIYYKQVTEGVMDKKKFEIMQNIGMTKKEVEKAINKQVKMVFFLPVGVALVHLAFCFKMIQTVLRIMGVTNIQVLLTSIIGTAVVYVLIYIVVYILTSKVYKNIINEK